MRGSFICALDAYNGLRVLGEDDYLRRFDGGYMPVSREGELINIDEPMKILLGGLMVDTYCQAVLQ